MCSRLTALFIGAALIFVLAGSAPAEEKFVIKPVSDAAEIKTFSSQGWLSMEGLPPKDHYLLKISYLRGFMDAIQFAEIAPGQTTQVLEDLNGLDLKELADQIDKFYQDHPQYQSYSPAVVVLVILPRIKAGKPPIPAPDEKPDAPALENSNQTSEQPASPPPANQPPESKP